jgi:aspartate racemase
LKFAGMIGGLGPESTIDYYRLLLARYRERVTDGSYPPLLINCVDVNRMVGWVSAGEYAKIVDYMVEEIARLQGGGCDFGFISANTPHIVFEEIATRVSLPLLSIVEAACEEARHMHLDRLGLFGTKFTMQGSFYPKVFLREKIDLVMPSDAEQEYINDKYMNELMHGVILPQTRLRLVEIAKRMRHQDRVQGIILAGTELPMILRGADAGVPFLDTTEIHVEAVLRRILD